MRHLLSLGHRAIGIITGNLPLQTAVDRLRGYKNALAEANIEIDPALIMEGDFRQQSGYVLTKQLLLGGRRPSALFVSNSMMGLGALRAMKEMAVCCPEDPAIAVFDELPGNGRFYPEVTAVVQPAYDIGFPGAELLIRKIEGENQEVPVAILLKPEMRIRESTLPRGRGSVLVQQNRDRQGAS
jgi:DNA-binding LacI/PurR family transcriptional regulator